MDSRSNLKVANRPQPTRAWSPPVRANGSAEGKVSSICVDLSDLRSDDVDNVKLRLEGDSLTITGYRIVPVDPPQAKMARNPDGSPRPAMVTEQQDFAYQFSLEPRRSPETLEAYYNPLQQELNIHIRTKLDEISIERGGVLHWREGEPFPIEIVSPEPQPLHPPTVLRHTSDLETEKHLERQMREQANKSFIQDGVRYWPLPLAAQMVQAPRQTLLNWIKNPKILFAGEPLQSYHFAPLDRYFVSDESIHRMANRFIRWPSQEPTGPVNIGRRKDKSGFIGMSEAADIAGVSKRTMWLWCSQPATAPPIDKPLDVIKCTTSNYFYIREKHAYDLKKLVPRSGLQRGRRPQLAPQP